jgi:phosphohistidine phosphatase
MKEEKTLFIIRHGKSTWDYPGVSDIDRPLKDRGIKDAHEMAGRIVKMQLMPDCIVSSPAARALHTSIIFARVLNFSADEIIINEDLYHADSYQCLSVIKETDDSRNALMIFGHNPGFTELVNMLSRLELDNLPTTGLAILKFNTDNWKGISRKSLTSESFDSPHNP